MSDWKIEDEKYTLSVEIPANTTAKVHVKTTKPENVTCDQQVTYIDYQDGYAVYEVPSGKYVFSSKFL